MADVFISHIEEDASIALEIARGLEEAGYTTWYYERDSHVGSLYLLQVGQAIEQCRAVVLMISPRSLGSNQVTNEVVRAYESGKPFLPVLREITHVEFQQRQPVWRQALGASVAICLPPEGVSTILPRLVDGLKTLGIRPKSREEREAETRAREQAKQAAGLLDRVERAQSLENWSEAATLLEQIEDLAPDDAMIQDKLQDIQQRQREGQCSLLRARAQDLAREEKWDEALSTWSEYLALEPEDQETVKVELQQVEKLQEMARAYAEAQTAMAKKDYDRAIELLKGLVIQDETYKQASRLLAKTVELRRTGGRPKPSRWLWGAVAAVALVAVVLALTQVLPWLARSGQETTPLGTETVAGTIPVGTSPILDGSPTPSVAERATPTKPSEPTPGAATPTHSPEPTPRTATPTRSLEPTSSATPKLPAASPITSPTPAGTVPSQSVSVPDAVVFEFFSPGPSPAALAVAGDFLWIVNDQPRMLYQLDRAGVPLASLPITPTGTIRGLAWDGEALRLASGRQVVRLNTDGTVLASFSLPFEPTGLAWNPADATLWTAQARDEFLLEFSADGRLLQTLHAPVHGGPLGLAWAPDGLWVVSVFLNCYRFSFGGEELRSAYLPVGTFASNLALTWDERGYLWVTAQSERQIHQLSLREVQLTPTVTPGTGGELALPRPQLKPAAITDKAIVHVTNNLQGTLSLSFGDESVILKPDDTWSAELSGGVYTVFASASVPEPIAFSGTELLVDGYEYTWVLYPPE